MVGFGATPTSGSLFGNSAPSTQSSGGLFGGSSSAFGTTNTGSGLFGQSTSTGTSLFGSSGLQTTTPTGTTLKFNPPTGTDAMMKDGVETWIGTMHQCITCMKEYENKSLEELRVEDYAANRKGGTAGGTTFGGATQQTGGLFGSTAAASTSDFGFGNTTQSKSLIFTTGATNAFGSTNLFGQPAQNQNTGLFGKSVVFGATTTAAPVFNFGGTSTMGTGTSLLGQNNQQKPLFGQTTSAPGLFGNTATTQSAGFGSTTGFVAFGATNQKSTGLFGAKPIGFGTTNTTTTNSFSFGNANNMSGGGLFGQKQAAPAFGSTGFGTQTSEFGQSDFFSFRWRSSKMELSIESPCQHITWKVPNFFQLISKIGYSLISPEFRFADDRYCLRFYPKGDRNGDTADFELQLVRLTSTFPEGTVLYKVGYREKYDVGNDLDTYHYSGTLIDEFGFCLSRPQLEERRDKYIKDGTLTVLCSMRLGEQSSSGSRQSEEVRTFNVEEKQKGLQGVAKLQSDYRRVLQKESESDACLVVSGKEFRAHRFVLRARSDVFAAMFGHETAEKESGRVVIEDLDPDSFEEFLEYLYTGAVEAGLSDENAFWLYAAAEKYDVPIK